MVPSWHRQTMPHRRRQPPTHDCRCGCCYPTTATMLSSGQMKQTSSFLFDDPPLLYFTMYPFLFRRVDPEKKIMPWWDTKQKRKKSTSCVVRPCVCPWVGTYRTVTNIPVRTVPDYCSLYLDVELLLKIYSVSTTCIDK